VKGKGRPRTGHEFPEGLDESWVVSATPRPLYSGERPGGGTDRNHDKVLSQCGWFVGKGLNPKPSEYLLVTHSIATYHTVVLFSIMQNKNFKLK
jgi:hypothetical protein